MHYNNKKLTEELSHCGKAKNVEEFSETKYRNQSLTMSFWDWYSVFHQLYGRSLSIEL